MSIRVSTGYSTMTTLLNKMDKWLYNIDEGLVNGIMFLDMLKAFDTVDHSILISKLKAYGVNDNCLKLFISSLIINRAQKCKINQTLSEVNSVTCGVPQRSNLGPLLFLIYINDLPNCLEFSSTVMFADDTNLTVEAKSSNEQQQMLNKDLENIHKWLVANRLSLNVDKTEYMIVGTHSKLLNIGNNSTVH